MFPDPPRSPLAAFVRADLRHFPLSGKPCVVVWLDPSDTRQAGRLAFSLTPSDAAHLAASIDVALAALQRGPDHER